MVSCAPGILVFCAAIVLAAPGAIGEVVARDGVAGDEVRAIAARVMADAGTRSSLMGEGGGAGHDEGFFIADSEGNFRLNIEGQIIARYTLNFREEGTGDSDFESAFTIQRATLEFSGHIISPKVLYRIGLNAVRDRAEGGAFELEDAYMGYVFENGLVVLAGQALVPVLWEGQIYEKYSLAADRSVVNSVFDPDRMQGVWLSYAAEWWRAWGGFGDGVLSANTDLGEDSSDYALTTRWEFKWAGEWEQFDRFSSPPGSEYAGRVAGSFHWQGGPNREGFTYTNLAAYSVDTMMEGDGWNLYTVFTGRYTDAGGDRLNDFGVLVQGGVFLPETDWEVFGRYDVVLPDGDRENSDAFNTITFGLNWYLAGQAAKFTFDVQWSLDATTSNDLVAEIATGKTGSRGNQIDLLPSSADNQVSPRFQFQLLF